MMLRRNFVCGVLAASALAVLPAMQSAWAKFPDHPIKLVVPFPAGGTNDIIARVVAQQVETQLGSAVVVDNRGGANGIIGTEAVAKAEPDGYTLLHVSSSFTINPSVYKKLPYNIFKDFAPVASIGIGRGYVIVVNPKLPVHDPAELVAYAKTHRLIYGSPGVGNPIQLATELFRVHNKIEMQNIPFRGTAPALTALLSDVVQVMFVPPASVLGYIESKDLRVIGFTGAEPLPELPKVPLTKDTDSGLVIGGSWHGWFAPAKTPPEVVDAINKQVRAALKVKKVSDLIEQSGYVPDDKTPAEFATMIHPNAEAMARAAKAAKIEPQ
jgi:tripartite-type tricarboxylate transporter receptor subunit TctC